MCQSIKISKLKKSHSMIMEKNIVSYKVLNNIVEAKKKVKNK